MPFIAKCYNGHKIRVDDEYEGETIECPFCEENFIAVRDYEELGKVNEHKVPLNTRGYIHIGTGLIIGGLFSYIIQLFSGYSPHFVWRTVYYILLITGIFYLVRGFFELFNNRDPFWRIRLVFFKYFYIIWKKIKFFRK